MMVHRSLGLKNEFIEEQHLVKFQNHFTIHDEYDMYISAKDSKHLGPVI